MQARSKEAFIAAIKHAYAERLAEQRSYRQKIIAVMENSPNGQMEQSLAMPDEMTTGKLMEGECYPPSAEDWRILKGYSWKHIPNRQQLNKVADPDVSFWLYMLSEVSEHTQRLRATAKFLGHFGTTNPNILEHFNLWRICSMANMLKS